MNKVTMVRNAVTLCCGHSVSLVIRPKVAELIFCTRCNRGSVIQTVTRTSEQEDT